MNEILIDSKGWQTKVAVLEEGELVEYYVEDRDHEHLVGNIYRGKVADVLPGMEAAFIDIGLEKNAYLHVEDVFLRQSDGTDGGKNTSRYTFKPRLGISDLVKPGQDITVQVIKEPFGTKGPRVTTKLTVPGKYLVLLPNDDNISVSRRIEKEDERKRLKAIMESLKPPGVGFIIRTAADGAVEEELEQDILFLQKLWDKISKSAERGKVPRILYKDDGLVFQTVRDMLNRSVDRLWINNYSDYEKALEWAEMVSPSFKNRIRYFEEGSESLFESRYVETMLKKALARKIWLKCGGYLIIDQTEALTVIDVNTGKFTGSKDLENTVLRANVEAAHEIAKQLRLRDIGGIIIIDFIDMSRAENRSQVLDALRNALQKDRTRSTVVGITGLGLVEMTRKKVRQNLMSQVTVECPYCNGTGRVVQDVRKTGTGT